jgi:lipooligosaccharide transport system ATP-binding protein
MTHSHQATPDSPTAERDTPVIAAEGLVKSFGALRAVDGISFSVERGSCCGLLGPNGAGKTTTIRMLYGFSPPDAGRLRIFGLDVGADGRLIRSRLGVCQQADSLDPDLTVRENLLLFASYFGIPRAVAARRADELLAFMALEGKRPAGIGELSGGMARRLMLARALVNDPELVILDEPTTGLDPQARHQVWERLETLRRRGLTILLTTHYMEEASRLADRVIIVDHGRILDQGTPRELVARHIGGGVIEIPEPTDEVRRFVAERGLDREDLGHRLVIHTDDGEALYREITGRFCDGECTLRTAGLEDVFLKLTGRGLRE